MAWQDEEIADSPFNKLERKGLRRVLKWFERRTFLRAAVGNWLRWVVLLPAFMIALYQLYQYLMH